MEMSHDLRMTGESEHTDRQFVNALARGLELLRCFQPGRAYLTNADLARETGFPKPTVTRLTYTLKKLGYLDSSDAMGKYMLSSGVLGLGYSMLANLVEIGRASCRERVCPYVSISVVE